MYMIKFRWQHKLFIFLLLMVWIYTGNFQIFGVFPPDIEKAQAATLPTIYVDGDAGDGDDSANVWETSTNHNTCDTFVCAVWIDQVLGLPNTSLSNDWSETTATQGFQIDDMPSDFADMDTFSIAVRFRDNQDGDDTVALTAQIVESDGSTALTNSIAVHTHDGSESTYANTSTLNFTLTGTNNKTVWDGAELELTWTYSRSMGGDNMNIQVSAVEMYGTYTTPTYTQSDWRIFANSDSYTAGSALAAESTGATLTSTGQAFRLRQLLDITVGDLAASGESFRLEYSTQSGTCDTGFTGESYSEITTSTPISYYDNASLTDGNNLTSSANDPTHGAHTTYNQTYEEGNDFTNSTQTISTPGDGMWDFSLYDNGASAGATYCIRVTKSDGTTISYSSIAEVTTASTPPSISIADNQVFDYNTATTSFETITITDTQGAITAAGDLRISLASTTVGFKWDTTDTTASFGGTASAKASNPVSFENASTTLVVPISSDFTAGQTLTISGLAFAEFPGVLASSSPYIGYNDSGSIASYASESVAVQGVATTSEHYLGQISDQWGTDSATTSVVYRYSMRAQGEGLNIATTTFSLSSITGVDNSNVNYARLYLDSDKDGRISTSTDSVSAMRPVATSTAGNLLASGCTTKGNWSCVDEISADDDTTYLYTSSAGLANYETFRPGNSTVRGLISKVTLYNEVAVTSTGVGSASASGVLFIGATPYSSNSTTTPTANGTYVTMTDEWTTNPATNEPWTWEEVNDLSYGIFFSTAIASGREFRYTQSYIDVDYCDTTQYDCQIGGDWSGDVNISGSTGTIDFATSTHYHIEPRASSTVWTAYDVVADSNYGRIQSVFYDSFHGKYLAAGYDGSTGAGCDTSTCKATVWSTNDFVNWDQNTLVSDFGSVAYAIMYIEDLGKFLVGGNDNDYGSASSNIDAAIWHGTTLSGLERVILSSLDSVTEVVYSVTYNSTDSEAVAAGVASSDATAWYSGASDLTSWNEVTINSDPSLIYSVTFDILLDVYFFAGYQGPATTYASAWRSATVTGASADVNNIGPASSVNRSSVIRGSTLYTFIDDPSGAVITVASSTKQGDWTTGPSISGGTPSPNAMTEDPYQNVLYVFGSKTNSSVDATAWESIDGSSWTERTIDSRTNTQVAYSAKFDDRNGVLYTGGYKNNGTDDDSVVWVSGTESHDFLLEMSVTGLANSDTITIDLLPSNIDGINGYISGLGSATGTVSSVTHTSDVTAGNSTPSVSSVSLNAGSDIVLTEGTYKWVSTTMTVSDDDTLTDISSVVASLFVASTTGWGDYGPNCTADDLNCYHDTDYSACYKKTELDTNTATFECGFKVWYVAYPTASGASWDTSIWTVSATATDMSAAFSNATNTTQQIEIEELTAFAITPSFIDFGSLEPGINTDTSNPTVNIVSTGNSPIDVQLSGTDLTDGSNIILASNQKYESSSFDYDTDGIALSGTPTTLELAINPPTSTTTVNNWSQEGGDGTGWTGAGVRRLITHDRSLIAGITTQEEVWQKDFSVPASSWSQIGGDGAGWSDATYNSLEDIVSFEGKLYVSFGLAANMSDVWEYDGSTWTQIGGDSLNSGWSGSSETAVRSIVGFEAGKIAVGTSGGAGDGDVWEYNGSTWTQIGGDTLNSGWSTDTWVNDLKYGPDGYLYASLQSDNDLWRYSTSTDTWSQFAGDGLSGSWSAPGYYVQDIIFDWPNIYVGMGNTLTDGAAEVWKYDGSAWQQIGGDGAGWSGYRTVYAIELAAGDLYAGLSGSADGDGELRRYRNGHWSKVGGDALDSSWADSDIARTYSVLGYNGLLYVGLGSQTGDGDLWEYSPSYGSGNDLIYWGLSVPSGRPSGSYSGVNTISATPD